MDPKQTPKKIAISKAPPGIVIEWADGLSKTLSFDFIRKTCPCALCRGESTPLDIDPLSLPVAQDLPPGATEAKDMFKVGAYAVGFRWGDGHDTGIYSFEYLRALCETEMKDG